MTDPWQLTDKQAKEHGQVALDTKARLRAELASGFIEFSKTCGVRLPESAHPKIVKLLEELEAP